MRRRLAIALALLVVVPPIIFGWLGIQVARDEREVLRVRLQDLVAARLGDLDRQIADLLTARRDELATLTRTVKSDPESLRNAVRRAPRVRQLFILGADGQLVFPRGDQPITRDEREFLLRTRQLWTKRDLFERPAEGGAGRSGGALGEEQRGAPAQQVTSVEPAAPAERRTSAAPTVPSSARVDRGVAKGERSTPSKSAAPLKEDAPSRKAAPSEERGPVLSAERDGWYTWFAGDDLGLLYWRKEASGRVIGAELDRVRLLSDIVAALPATPAHPDAASQTDRVMLVDARGNAVYQWGTHAPAADEAPVVERPLSAPLAAWKLRTYVSPSARDAAGGGVLLSLVGGLAALALALLGLGVYFYRESARDLGVARQRVSFVNQVSHELKTPLTNIRMYAELLARDIEALEEDVGEGVAGRRLEIIVSESQRLSRLIGNVLTFARQGRGALRLRPTPGVVDDVVRDVVEQFRPALAERRITPELDLQAGASVRLDRDVLEQIVANLISNAEKYAPGGPLRIATRVEGEVVSVLVHDSGPGIPLERAAEAFAPFGRLDDRITEGAAGTGIGLALARDLARLHGGDLVIEPSDGGACLLLTVRCPAA